MEDVGGGGGVERGGGILKWSIFCLRPTAFLFCFKIQISQNYKFDGFKFNLLITNILILTKFVKCYGPIKPN